MSSRSIAVEAVASFAMWVGYSKIDSRCLSDFIYAWVASGEGIRACHGDYPTYLVGVIAIIEAWHDGRLKLNRLTPEDGEIERQVSKMFDRDDELDDDYDGILDPHWFAHCTFNTLYPKLDHS